MEHLVGQYTDLPLGAVDASVIAIAERLKVADIATLDHREVVPGLGVRRRVRGAGPAGVVTGQVGGHGVTDG